MEAQNSTDGMKPYLDALKCYDPSSDQKILADEANKLFRVFVERRDDKSIRELQNFLDERAKSLGSSEKVPDAIKDEYNAWQQYLEVRSWRRACIAQRESAKGWTRKCQTTFKKLLSKFKDLVTKNQLSALRGSNIRAHAIVWIVDEVMLVCQRFEKYDKALNIVDLVADSRYNISQSFLKIKKMEKFVSDAAHLWMKYRDAEHNRLARQSYR
uniref:Nuclear pore complex protein n=1 Tax=Lotharella oceanica TaxID=641309 RepID=A0A7S2TYC1_9EUKA